MENHSVKLLFQVAYPNPQKTPHSFVPNKKKNTHTFPSAFLNGFGKCMACIELLEYNTHDRNGQLM